MNEIKKIVVLTGTRAEFGKMQPLIKALSENPYYEVHLFVTGMHLLEKYGGTAREILRVFNNVYLYNNQAHASRLDIVLSNTIYGFSHYVNEIKPDLILIHGDRAEALAGVIVGSFNNILVAHIEGGEISGTIDELIRHSISKLSHTHFVSNEQAKNRLLQMGEKTESIFVIGSPDIDIMFSPDLLTLEAVFKRYEIKFNDYAILMYHPVTTELEGLEERIRILVDAVIESKVNYIAIYPNNDPGADVILKEYERFEKAQNVQLFSSIRFEMFLVLLKNCKFILGNSSAGIREAPIFAVPTINLGSRQKNRFHHESIINTAETKDALLESIQAILNNPAKFEPSYFFGSGNSTQKFMEILEKKMYWETERQKQFLDL